MKILRLSFLKSDSWLTNECTHFDDSRFRPYRNQSTLLKECTLLYQRQIISYLLLLGWTKGEGEWYGTDYNSQVASYRSIGNIFIVWVLFFSTEKQNSHHEIIADESVWSFLEVVIRFETTPLTSLSLLWSLINDDLPLVPFVLFLQFRWFFVEPQSHPPDLVGRPFLISVPDLTERCFKL